MPIVFRKIDNLTSNPRNEATPIGGGSGAQSTQNPYASTFQNPSNILSANINEKQADLDTGLNQNIKDAQQNLDKSTQTYTDKLKGIENEQTYAGQSELNKIDDNQFSKLQTLLSPDERQKRMDSTTSSTKYVNPDTSAVAAASSVEGLSNQLRNQYNTTAGGSRLDALLYRNSGQAGQALNKNLSDIGAFNTTRDNYLNNEKTALANSKENLANTANTVRNDVQGLKQQLGTEAQQKATDAQSSYNTARQNLLNNEIPNLQATTIQNLLQDVAAQNNLTQYLPGQNQRSSFQYVPNIDPSLYVSPERTFDQSQFLDSRFNRLAGLLGENQITPSATPADTNATFNRDEYLNALQESARPDLLQFLQSRVPAPQPESVNGGGYNTVTDYLIPGALGGVYATKPVRDVGKNIVSGLLNLF